LLVSVQNRRGDEQGEEKKKREERDKEGNRTEESVTTLKTQVSFLC
jgi:hypothetical protein